MKLLGILISILLLGMAIFFGLGPNPTNIDEQFAAMVSEQATPESLVFANEYLGKNIGKLNKDKATKIVMQYEDFMLKYINSDADWTVLDQICTYWNEDIAAIEGDKIKSEELLYTYNQLVTAGFYFLSSEGIPYPAINYTELLSKYEGKISPALIELYKIKQMEADYPMVIDASLVISWGELANRTLATEIFVHKYKNDYDTLEDGTFMYQNYINTLLMGIDNTPTFGIEDNQFSSDAKEQYIDFINNNPDSVTAYILTEYITYLESINYKLDYANEEQSKIYFDTCTWLVSEAGKRVID
jgi:hypothetical protein